MSDLDKIEIAVKPLLSIKIIAHTLERGIKPDSILTDETYGPKASSGVLFNSVGKAYVLEIASYQLP